MTFKNLIPLTHLDAVVLSVSAFLAAVLIGLVFVTDHGHAARSPRVAYLTPADNSAPANIWITHLDGLTSSEQVTFSPSGITSFTVSPDGHQIIFSERDGVKGLSNLKRVDLETGDLQQETNCIDSRCSNPVWSPTGRFVAYERVNFNSTLAGVSPSPSRIWLLDLLADPPTTYPLFDDTQSLGSSPVWSANGTRIAVYDRGLPGVRIHDFEQARDIVVKSLYGIVGFLSPDGSLLALPKVESETTDLHPHIQLINLETKDASPIDAMSDEFGEEVAAWSPDGQSLVMSRRRFADVTSRGETLSMVNIKTRTAQPLNIDNSATNTFMSWDAEGTRLLLQRVKLTSDQAELTSPRPELWVYDIPTNHLIEVAPNSFNPRWIP